MQRLMVSSREPERWWLWRHRFWPKKFWLKKKVCGAKLQKVTPLPLFSQPCRTCGRCTSNSSLELSLANCCQLGHPFHSSRKLSSSEAFLENPIGCRGISTIVTLNVKAFKKAFEKAGAPPGLVSVLHSTHEVVADIMDNPAVGFVTFTGSVGGGRQVYSTVGHKRFIDVSMYWLQSPATNRSSGIRREGSSLRRSRCQYWGCRRWTSRWRLLQCWTGSHYLHFLMLRLFHWLIVLLWNWTRLRSQVKIRRVRWLRSQVCPGL